MLVDAVASDDATGVVYFLLDRTIHGLKVGYTSNLARRLAQYEDAYPNPLDLLATIPATRLHERRLHDALSHARLRYAKEWYEPNMALPHLIAGNVGAVRWPAGSGGCPWPYDSHRRPHPWFASRRQHRTAYESKRIECPACRQASFADSSGLVDRFVEAWGPEGPHARDFTAT